jgi:hypothetical protein
LAARPFTTTIPFDFGDLFLDQILNDFFMDFAVAKGEVFIDKNSRSSRINANVSGGWSKTSLKILVAEVNKMHITPEKVIPIAVELRNFMRIGGGLVFPADEVDD